MAISKKGILFIKAFDPDDSYCNMLLKKVPYKTEIILWITSKSIDNRQSVERIFL